MRLLAAFGRRARLGLGLIIAFAALWGAWSTTRPGGDFAFLMFQDWATVGTAVLAAILICLGARKSSARVRVGLLLIGAGIACWAFGEVGWARSDIYGEKPFPSLLDVMYLAGYVPLTAGAVLIASPDRSLARTRTALDGMALVLSMTAFVWHLVLEPIYTDSESTLVAKAVAGAYPVLDLVVLFALLIAVVRYSNRGGAAMVGVLSLGIALNVASDIAFAFVSLHAWDTVGEWLNAGWVFGYLFMALAAVLQLEKPLEQPAADDRANLPAAWRQAAPLTLILGFVGFVAVRPDALSGDLPFLVMLALAALAITARQFVVVQDNVRLNGALADSGRMLETRVQERTHELARLVSILEATPDVVVTADLQGTPSYVNRSGRILFGLPVDSGAIATSGLNLFDHIPAWVSDLIQTEALPEALRKGTWTGEAAVVASGGREIPTSHAVVIHRDGHGGVQFVSHIARDISVQKQLESDLRRQAFHDALTGLANRARFIDRLEHALIRARRTADTVAVLFVDLDQFKSVNDSYGHSLGDQLLVKVGQLLSTLVRQGDTVARLGGDEFAILLDGSVDLSTAEAAASRLVESLRTPLIVDGREVFAHASIGVALASGSEDGGELLRRADLAMYTAKANGKNRFEVFDQGVQSAMGARLRLLNELEGAVERNEFVLHYQPTVSMDSGEMVGIEALVRWKHPQRGLLPPATFIPLAEESGVIVPLGRWVLTEACRQFKLWQQRHPASSMQSIAVNVSARQIYDAGFIQDVATILEQSGVAPECLTVEITESATMRDVETTVRVLKELKQRGVRLAIDDFGTGYSSLSYLRQFPFDVLKIDKSFIDAIGDGDVKLTSAIVTIGKSLELDIVAEGVEQREQLDSLRTLECDVVQGYYFSRPVTAGEIDELLDHPGLMTGADVHRDEQVTTSRDAA
jgi:diguanylate cyclase (GGDEF)-like protein/PAS domain S-box-containing protein